ncbi:MAG: sigma 54-interacting transcriptional regulator [Acidobacteriota bacterium]
MTLGSAESCEVHLPFSGVGERHALLVDDGVGLEIRDLGTSRRGVLVNGRRVDAAPLEELDEVRLGSIALLLEEVAPPAPERRDDTPPPPLDVVATPARLLEHLAAVSRWVLGDPSAGVTLESRVVALLEDFGGGVLYLFHVAGEESSAEAVSDGVSEPGVRFVASTDPAWLGAGSEILDQLTVDGRLPPPGPAAAGLDGRLDGAPCWIAWRAFRALERDYLVAIALPRFVPDDFSPLAGFATLSDQLILGLVHHVGEYEPLLFGRERTRELTLVEGLIVGESPAMKRVLDELRSAVDLEEPVLLRGEAGVSKELLARSLHASGARAERPFSVVRCDSAGDALEAELFGGRVGRAVRDGRLAESDGGTLYLEDVDHLPLALQGRLMRFLRSAEIEAADGHGSIILDVRLIASARESLDAAASRDQFRLDLAWRLSQLALDVPALRERRGDLPLLIQAAVNRCCHETGKRVQGITVKAMEALTAHDYPGNLDELQAIVRRLVYLCPAQRPIDERLLPDEIRRSSLEGLKPRLGSDLHLEPLVADTERAVIREALRRAARNKSEAARQLGLSRNGLAMKMRRLGLEA